MLRDGSLTYISLFSSAGVGCYGFKMAGYHCVATSEIIERRMQVQRYNNKCEREQGYICGDLTKTETKNQVYNEIDYWRKKGNDGIDVVLATPPCQGISVINHKKNSEEIKRNSLVVESIEMVSAIRPRVFIFENVMAFQKTLCITRDERAIPIGDYIREVLGDNYVISGRVLNFMNYGSNSSRTRTLIVGIDKKYREYFVPYDLYPNYRREPSLRDVIFDMPPLEWGEICKDDFYHAFRTYDPRMREWIHDLCEGESAFDNDEPRKRPHRVIDGRIVENIKKNRDKYTRQLWDRFAQCVHTRNDQLAAQNTIHPVEDRVFSIRELMKMMTVPDTFNWVGMDLDELNALSEDEKRRVYRNNEVNIRQCLGEAVPTRVLYQIACEIKNRLKENNASANEINKIIADNDLTNRSNLYPFLKNNPLDLNMSSLVRITELCNGKREKNAAFYTNRFIVNEIIGEIPPISGDTIRIIEPSVGAGSFLPFIFKRFAGEQKVILDVVDIDHDSLKAFKTLLKKEEIPENFTINCVCEDFLAYLPKYRYNLAIGNPPFSKIESDDKNYVVALKENANKRTRNLSEIFLEKCMRISDYVALVLNKTIFSTDEFRETRDVLRNKRIDKVIDFGRYGFCGVSIETMCVMIRCGIRPDKTKIINLKHNFSILQAQNYITDKEYPYFLLYRNKDFDEVASKLQFDVFDVFRDRQITKSNTSKNKVGDSIWVIKAKNLNDDGSGVSHIDGYDVYIPRTVAEDLTAYKYLDDFGVYLTPNMTYNTRVIKNIPGVIPDGSVAVLIPKREINLSDKQLEFFSSEEYRKFYTVARNLSTQSINVDKTSVFFYGVLRDDY